MTLLPQPPSFRSIAVAAGLLLMAGAGFALGFGHPQSSAVLGSPLSVTLPLQVQADERFDAACLRVEVQVGERRLPAYELRWSVAPGPRGEEPLLQLGTLGAIDEPKVSVLVSSHCGATISRRITLLTQPPAPPAAGAPPGAAVGPGDAAPAARLRLATSAASRLPAALPAHPRSAQASLRLDGALPRAGLSLAAALAIGIQAAVGDAAAQVAGDQIKVLEQQVQAVLTEAHRQQALLVQLRQQLVAAESASAWLPWLLLGLVASGALAIWLALRVRRLQRELAQRDWSHADAGRGAATLPGAATAGATPLLSPDQPLLSPGGVATAPDLTIAQPRVLPALPAVPESVPKTQEFSLGTGVPPRPVSVEELLDLDQQVDFFLVLGQEQAAIDLLLAHVRSTGGTSASPYFKLLEIYRQQEDEEAYERTRERFNQRFNAFAPDWSGDLAGGRHLEDYAEVVQRLQRAWNQPLRAVAELESLLLRRADLEPFDLPAYREVLMLHALVRDLPAGTLHAATTTVPRQALAATAEPAAEPTVAEAAGAIDLLLPLDDGPAGELTAPRAQVSERSSAQAMLAQWVFSRSGQPQAADPADPAGRVDLSLDLPSRPAALDLDLSDLAPAPREFTRPAAFTDIDQRRDSRLSDLGDLDVDDRPRPPATRS